MSSICSMFGSMIEGCIDSFKVESLRICYLNYAAITPMEKSLLDEIVKEKLKTLDDEKF